MDEYYETNSLQARTLRRRRNNSGEPEKISEVNWETLQQEKADKSEVTIKHLQELKKLLKNIAKKNSKSILSSIFHFDPEEYLGRRLLFNLKKTSEEKTFDATLEKIPNNNT